MVSDSVLIVTVIQFYYTECLKSIKTGLIYILLLKLMHREVKVYTDHNVIGMPQHGLRLGEEYYIERLISVTSTDKTIE